MSWYYYEDRGRRRKITLKTSQLPKDIRKAALEVARENETIAWVEVMGRQTREGVTQVGLQFWCHTLDPEEWAGTQRYTVFALNFPENPKWVCQGN